MLIKLLIGFLLGFMLVAGCTSRAQTFDDCQILYTTYQNATGNTDDEYRDYHVCATSLELQSEFVNSGLAMGTTTKSIMSWFAPTLIILLFAHLALGLSKWFPR